MNMKSTFLGKAIMAMVAATGLYAATGTQTDQLMDHLTVLKQSMAQSKQQLKQYQWTQTTTFFHDGDEISQKQYSARYGPDGTIQKTLISATPEKKEHFLKKHIVDHKKKEIQEYMERAEALIKLYVPPSLERLQSAKDAGNASINLIDPGQRVRVTFRNYELPGDTLAIDLNPTTKRILGGTVNTYVDTPEDTVDLSMQFGSLPDGTMHPSVVDLSTKKHNVRIMTTNSNYRKITS
jgi:hypothetical protein